MSAQIPATQPFVPVITGGDLGAYSLAREFHEAYGVHSVVVPTAENLVVGGSKLTQLCPAGQMFDAAHVLAHLGNVADELQRDTKRPLMLLPGYDHLVRIVVDHSAQLRDMGYVFPELSATQLDQAALKEQFYGPFATDLKNNRISHCRVERLLQISVDCGRKILEPGCNARSCTKQSDGIRPI